MNKNIKIKRKDNLLWGVWRSMKNRCNLKSSYGYRWYGANGITYEPKWEVFENFEKDMKRGYKKGLTLDRIDSNENYSKANCRWATWVVQQNNRRNNRKIKFNGETKTLTQWAKDFNIKRSTIAQRFYVYKWSIERCFSPLYIHE